MTDVRVIFHHSCYKSVKKLICALSKIHSITSGYLTASGGTKHKRLKTAILSFRTAVRFV
jgi:hypothetical protein